MREYLSNSNSRRGGGGGAQVHLRVPRDLPPERINVLLVSKIVVHGGKSQ